MNSTSISKREAEVIDAIEDRDIVVFGPRDVERFLTVSSRNATRILTNMVDKDLIRRLGRGEYVLTETYDSRDSYELASHLEPASYIGFWSALHFHGLTEQVPRTIFIAVTKQKRSRHIQGQTVRFVRVSPATFFGYDQYGGTVVSTPEKTLLDCLRLQEYAGGIQLVYDAIPPDLDVDRVIQYAHRLGNGAVAARLGYLLERNGLLDGRDRLQSLVSSYAKLDQSGERTNPIAEWKLYANVTLDD